MESLLLLRFLCCKTDLNNVLNCAQICLPVNSLPDYEFFPDQTMWTTHILQLIYFFLDFARGNINKNTAKWNTYTITFLL